MKTILVPVGGGEKDEAVFQTALGIARPLSAHLDFYHVRVSLGEAAVHTPHFDFAMGSALLPAMDELQGQLDGRAAGARSHVNDFCRRFEIAIVDTPRGSDSVSASWCEEDGRSLETILRRARYSDFVVMGRHTSPDGLPADLLDLLLLECGRPVVVAPVRSPHTLTETVMICWKETAQAARALTASMPLLTQAKRVIVVSLPEGNGDSTKAANDLARQMSWSNIHAEVRDVETRHGSRTELLLSAARDCHADLVVMGGYGHSLTREMIFGGATRTFLNDADTAVMLAH
jgi:nucleotide-binding universal stress UspA family protein